MNNDDLAKRLQDLDDYLEYQIQVQFQIFDVSKLQLYQTLSLRDGRSSVKRVVDGVEIVVQVEYRPISSFGITVEQVIDFYQDSWFHFNKSKKNIIQQCISLGDCIFALTVLKKVPQLLYQKAVDETALSVLISKMLKEFEKFQQQPLLFELFRMLSPELTILSKFDDFMKLVELFPNILSYLDIETIKRRPKSVTFDAMISNIQRNASTVEELRLLLFFRILPCDDNNSTYRNLLSHFEALRNYNFAFLSPKLSEYLLKYLVEEANANYFDVTTVAGKLIHDTVTTKTCRIAVLDKLIVAVLASYGMLQIGQDTTVKAALDKATQLVFRCDRFQSLQQRVGELAMETIFSRLSSFLDFKGPF